MRSRVWGLVVGVLLAAATPALSAGSPVVSVVLELSQDYYYAGDPVLIRLSVRNAGTTAVVNPVTLPLLQGLKVRHGGGSQLQPASSGAVQEPNRPERLAPQSFYGSVIDISGIYPQTLETGAFEMIWEGSGLRSQVVAVNVVPPFDPDADYVADLVTNVGSIRLDLFEGPSPIAVKAFVDLAQSGYYDDLEIHEVREDQWIAGGEPPAGRRPFVFPAEQSELPLQPGTVILKPADAAPPTNGSGFMILLAPQPALAEQVTVLGEVVLGLETVRSLARIASTGPEGSPPFRPATPIKIEKVLISKQNPAIGDLREPDITPPRPGQEFVDLSGASPYIQTR